MEPIPLTRELREALYAALLQARLLTVFKDKRYLATANQLIDLNGGAAVAALPAAMLDSSLRYQAFLLAAVHLRLGAPWDGWLTQILAEEAL